MSGGCFNGHCDAMKGASGVNTFIPAKKQSKGFEGSNVWSENVGFSLEIPAVSIFHGPEYKEVPAKYEPVSDETIDNMYNGEGKEILKTQSTEKQDTKKNTAVNSVLGFLADGVTGKGSQFVVNNKASNLPKEFVEQLDINNDGFISKEEYTDKMVDLKLQAQKAKNNGENYYGSDKVQYSENKEQASFTAIDRSNDAEVSDGMLSKEEVKNFFAKTLVNDGTPFTRNENGKDVTYDDVSRIKFENLPPEIKAATTTEQMVKSSEIIIDKPSYSEVVKKAEVASGRIKVGEAQQYSNAKHGEVKKDPTAEALLNVVKKLQGTKKEMVLADIYAAMSESGISEKETKALLKKGLTPGLQESFYNAYLDNGNTVFKPSKDMQIALNKMNLPASNFVADEK